MKNIIFASVAAIFCLTGFSRALVDLPAPYDSVSINKSFDFTKWKKDLANVSNTIGSRTITNVAILGNWWGISAVDIAAQLPAGAKLYAIDDGLSPLRVQHYNQRDYVPRLAKKAYEQFLANVIIADLYNTIFPVKSTILAAAASLDIHPEIIFVDANYAHDEDAYNDIKAWYPKLPFNGIICGTNYQHDIQNRGVVRFAREKNIRHYTNINFWQIGPKEEEDFEEFSTRDNPGFTDEAISFLETYLTEHPDAKILEFGSGSSTVWLAKRTTNLTSVEINDNWHDFIKTTLESTPACKAVNYLLFNRTYETYADYFGKESFDLILIKGAHRKRSVINAVELVKSGGIIMLNNSERAFYSSVFDHFNTCVYRGSEESADPILESTTPWESVETVQASSDSDHYRYQGQKTTLWYRP